MVLPCTRELHFHFLAGPKKGSKMGAKMEPFGLPNPNYTHFGAPFGRNCAQNECRIWRGEALQGV